MTNTEVFSSGLFLPSFLCLFFGGHRGDWFPPIVDRDIQGWRRGVIASSWFRLRGNPKFFTLSNLLFSFFLRLRKARSPPQSLLAMTEKGEFPLPWFRPLIEPFKGNTSFVMPERFYQASTSFVIPEIFYRESMFLNNLDPGLKIAGVTRRGGIQRF